MNDVTRILSSIDQGDPHTPDELLPLVYDELRRLAAQKLAFEAPGQTLQATALVHEAYVRLVDAERVQSWQSRGHFFSAAAAAMRRILIENARRKQAVIHGGSLSRRSIDEVDITTATPSDDLLALDEWHCHGGASLYVGPPNLVAQPRHGAGQWDPYHRILRSRAARHPRAARAVRSGLRGHAARAPEEDHPSRP